MFVYHFLILALKTNLFSLQKSIIQSRGVGSVLCLFRRPDTSTVVSWLLRNKLPFTKLRLIIPQFYNYSTKKQGLKMFDEKNTNFIEVIDRFVQTWTKKYIFYTKKDEKTNRYICEFSLPTQQKPIPISTVRVYFFTESQGEGRCDLKFQFETDELVHKMGKTVRLSMMEKWLEKYLEKKNMTRRVFFLASEVPILL